MPVVRVWTAKYSTVPKSFTVSIITMAAPAAMAGRLSGRPTLQNRRSGPAPSARATS